MPEPSNIITLKSLPKIAAAAFIAFCIGELPSVSADLQSEGVHYFETGNFSKALESFNTALKEHPNDWKTLQSIASCDNRLGHFDAAINDLQKSIEIGGLHASQCTIMAGALEGLGEPKKALHWLELACSVEPAQAANPGIQAAIRRLQDPTINPVGSPNAPDYVSGLLSVNRWRQQDFPIRVFVRRNLQIPEYYDRYLQIVRGCLEQWCHATDNVVFYKFVNDKESANLVCDYTDQRQMVSPDHEPGLDGNSENRIRFQDKTTDWANITILVRNGPQAPFRNPALTTKTFLHELGHALGMHGHSPNPHDIMFLAATPEPTYKLTERDENTIRKIYPIPATAQKLQRAGDDAFTANNFAKAMDYYSAALKQYPKSWLILQNIGNCYMQLGHYDKAIDYLRKSLELGGMHTSQCKDMAAVYHRLSQPDNEACWLNVACSFDPAMASNPQVQATIKRLEDPIIHPTGSPSTLDYLSSTFHIDKWPKDDMPLTVYVKRNSDLPGFYNEFTELVRKSLDEWCKAANGSISYKFTDKPESAKLLWDYTDRPEVSTSIYELGSAGATDLAVHLQDGKVTQAHTVVLVKENPRAPSFFSRDLINKICLHELGHALGIRGHSPNQNDVMFPASTVDDKGHLTERDKNTMKKIYPAK